MKRSKRRSPEKAVKKTEKEKIKAQVFEEEEIEPIELGLSFYKLPAIISIVVTLLFYILVFVFVK